MPFHLKHTWELQAILSVHLVAVARTGQNRMRAARDLPGRQTDRGDRRSQPFYTCGAAGVQQAPLALARLSPAPSPSSTIPRLRVEYEIGPSIRSLARQTGRRRPRGGREGEGPTKPSYVSLPAPPCCFITAREREKTRAEE